MRIKFDNKTVECRAFVIIKNGKIWDIRMDYSDYIEAWENFEVDIIALNDEIRVYCPISEEV